MRRELVKVTPSFELDRTFTLGRTFPSRYVGRLVREVLRKVYSGFMGANLLHIEHGNYIRIQIKMQEKLKMYGCKTTHGEKL